MRMQAVARSTASGVLALLSVAVAAHAFSFLYRAARAGDPFAASFAASGLDVPAHFFLAGLALLLVPVQLSVGLRRRWPALHRQCGWLYVAAVLVASVSGFTLALDAQGGTWGRAAFVVLALLWPVVTVTGVVHAVRGDIASHRRWMLRSIALTTAAITLRLILGVGAGVLQLPFMDVYVASAWLSWTINLAACEAILRWPWWRARRALPASAG